MIEHTTHSGAVRLTLALDTTPLRPGEPQKWNVWLGGEQIVTRSRVPESDACRVLLARGITGRCSFFHAGETQGISTIIERHAELTVTEAGTRLVNGRLPPQPRSP